MPMGQETPQTHGHLEPRPGLRALPRKTTAASYPLHLLWLAAAWAGKAGKAMTASPSGVPEQARAGGQP